VTGVRGARFAPAVDRWLVARADEMGVSVSVVLRLAVEGLMREVEGSNFYAAAGRPARVPVGVASRSGGCPSGG
jgi:hypothetical protein